MKLKSKKRLVLGIWLFVSFMLWTVLVSVVDVQSIGPEASEVGLATMNGYVHDRIGVNLSLYDLTDFLSVIPLALVLGLGLSGGAQWIKNRSITKVDRSLLILGGYFVTVLAVFVFFELFPINYRPVLIEGVLEASYPSSTTLLVLCVMPPACMELRSKVSCRILSTVITVFTVVFCVFMVGARLVSGVHWLTDIIGATLLGGALVFTYSSIS